MAESNEDRRIMVAVHGVWGGGKSWFAHTAPGPRLIMDTEGGSEDVAHRDDGHNVNLISWDPMAEDIPTDLKPEDSVVVDIQNADMIPHLIGYLTKGDHPFESVILDSLTENQKQLKTAVAVPGGVYDPNAVFDQQAWGRLLNNGEIMIRQLRDLTRKQAKKRINVVVVMGSDTETMPVKPLLQGALRKSLAGFFDLEGFLYVGTDNETQEEVRVLQISPNATAEAKCRLHLVKVAYGNNIINPDMMKIIDIVNQTPEVKQ